MKIIGKTFKNTNHNFTVVVTTCNRRVATTKNLVTEEVTKFNRGKFEWMIQKGIFVEVVETE